jgi:TfoX/Sxy family transcriptional regulator of competence genes
LVIPMKWKKSPEKLVEFISERMSFEECEPRKMFGYQCYFKNNNMFTGLFEDKLFLRLGPDDREELAKKNKDVEGFQPLPGRIMKEYLIIPERIYSNKKAFDALVAKSMKFVSSLPLKQKKRKSKEVI